MNDQTTVSANSTAVQNIGEHLRMLLSDVFTLYMKTKNFHWHMTGAHFREYHLMLDEQGDQLFQMSDAIAERARKVGATTIHSIGEISRHQRLRDDDRDVLSPREMLAVLCDDNRQLTTFMRSTHACCDQYDDLATASLLENWIDESERRIWFLSETVRP